MKLDWGKRSLDHLVSREELVRTKRRWAGLMVDEIDIFISQMPPSGVYLPCSTCTANSPSSLDFAMSRYCRGKDDVVQDLREDISGLYNEVLYIASGYLLTSSCTSGLLLPDMIGFSQYLFETALNAPV